MVATSSVALLSWGYLDRLAIEAEEYYVLLLGAALGAVTLVGATHFATFFLGLEILSVSLYALIAYPVFAERYVEASVKYLVLGGSTSAFLLFGMALVYAVTGTHDARRDGRRHPARRRAVDLLVATGIVLILVGVGFKLAVVPFHMWTPDIYQGAPAPVTAFIATVSKTAVVALLLRFFRPVTADHTSAAVPGVRRHQHRLDAGRQPAGAAPGQREAHPGLLVHRAPGLHPGRVPGDGHGTVPSP